MRHLRVVLVIAVIGLFGCKDKDKPADKPSSDPPSMGKPSTEPKTAEPAAGAKTTDEPATKPPAPAAKVDGVGIATKVADEMCACHDAACATKVVLANQEAMETLAGYQPATAAEGDALMEASKRMSECAAKIPM